jgi:hypothetical protein
MWQAWYLCYSELLYRWSRILSSSLCAFVSQGSQHSIIEVKELEQEEHLAYRQAAAGLISWANDNHAYEACWRTFRELSETVEKFKQQHESGKNPHGVLVQQQVNDKMSNFLSAVRSFLDQTKRILTEEFGKDSEQVKAFEEATHCEYDRSFSYRLLDQLRNYSQHAGAVVGHVSLRSEAIDPVAQTSVHVLEISVDRDKLVAWRKLKASVREELKQQPDRIPLMPHVEALVPSLERVYVAATAQRIPTLVQQAAFVNNFLLPFNGYEGEPVIADFGDLPEGPVGSQASLNMKLEWIPHQLASHILTNHLQVRAGRNQQ